MNAWLGQWGKEFRQQRILITAWIAFEIVFIFAMYALSDRFTGVREAMLVLFLLLIVMLHFFFGTIYLLNSLRKEKKQLGLWLHNAQSGMSLLSVKVLQMLIFLIVSLMVSFIGFVFPFHDLLTYFGVNIPRPDFARYGGALFVQLGAASVLLSIVVMFFWTLYQVLVTRIGKWAGAVNIALFIGASMISDWFKETTIYATLAKWGKIFYWPSSFEGEVEKENVNIDIGEMNMSYIGEYLFWIVILLLLIFISGWLIDKKVEVQ